METYNLEKISDQWQPLAPLLSVPETETEYDSLASFMDCLTDTVGEDEGHPLASLMDTVGMLIESYENEHHPFSQGEPTDTLRYLMEINNLTRNNLPELGDPQVVSELLSGKRSLNVRQIQAMSRRFMVSPATFL